MTILNDLIKLNNELGYTNSDHGVCLGFSILWTEAQLLHQEEQFIARINRIGELAQAPDRLEKIKQMKAKKGQNLTSEDQELLDTLVFYDTLQLYHHAKQHSELFDPDKAPTQFDFDTATLSDVAASEAMQASGGLKKMSSECLAYQQEDIPTYLNALGDTLSRVQQETNSSDPIPLLLSTINKKNHALTLTYAGRDTDGKHQWNWVDTDSTFDDTFSFPLPTNSTETIAMLMASVCAEQVKYGAEDSSVERMIPVTESSFVSIFNLSAITTANNPHLTQFTESLETFKHRTTPSQRYNAEGLAHLAAYCGDTALINQLNNNQIDLDKTEKQKYRQLASTTRPIHLAAQNGHIDTLTALAESGAHIDISVMETAAHAGQAEIVAELAKPKYGLNVKEHPKLVWLAADQGHPQIIRELKKHDVNLNQLTHGMTPLFAAAFNGHIQTAVELISAGADINIPCAKLSSEALLMVAEKNGPDVIERMNQFISALDTSIDQNNVPVTPKEIAIIMGHQDIVTCLSRPVEATKTYRSAVQAIRRDDREINDDEHKPETPTP